MQDADEFEGISVCVHTEGLAVVLQAVNQVPAGTAAKHAASVVHLGSEHAPERSAGVRLLWWEEIPAVTAGRVALLNAELWHRVQEMPHTSQEEYLLASPATPPVRLTTSAVAFVSLGKVIPGNDFSGSFVVWIVASLVQPVVWQRPQE